MNITLFSRNQPRHLSLAKNLSQIADKIFFISEVNTVFTGKVVDNIQKSKVMEKYFKNVISAEKKLFGNIDFLPKNIYQLSIKSGDLNLLTKTQLSKALKSDIYIVFGTSYIKGWLIDFLVANQAINIHLGISPYYRGSSCNFWALYDNNPGYVGATIHILSKGLDNGDILFHCLPKFIEKDTLFDFTMRSVTAAHYGLCVSIKNKKISYIKKIKQDSGEEIRYSRKSDFTEKKAREFLERKYSFSKSNLKYPKLINPIFF